MWSTGNSESILFFSKKKKEYKPKKLLVVILTIILLEQFIKLLTPVMMERNVCHMGVFKKTHTHTHLVMVMSNNTDSLCMLLYISNGDKSEETIARVPTLNLLCIL